MNSIIIVSVFVILVALASRNIAAVMRDGGATEPPRSHHDETAVHQADRIKEVV